VEGKGDGRGGGKRGEGGGMIEGRRGVGTRDGGRRKG